MSTNVGGLPEVIGREENLYSMEDLSRLVAYVKRISENKDMLSSEQDYFFDRYHKLYTSESYVNKHLEIYGKYT